MGSGEDIDIPITLRVGVEHRFKRPNFVVLSHVYGEKPRFKWIAPLPKPKAPPCKRCGAACQLYGGIGGYSVQCYRCNELQSRKRRAASKSRKEGRA